MKRIICLALALMFCLCGCSGLISENKATLDFAENENEDEQIIDTAEREEFRGAWLPYYELAVPKSCQNAEKYKSHMEPLFENLERLKINNLFVQVRPFSDAIYPSKLFPSSAYACQKRGGKLFFDVFEALIELCKTHGMKVHAWINPYRVQSDFDLSKLAENEFAKKNFKNKSGDVVKAAGGLYFNPASLKVSKLLIEGVCEILENYDVDGIHIDDYFYPSTDESIDKALFSSYKSSGGRLSLASWRRENVSQTVCAIYKAVKSFGKDKLFSISPGGDIEKNKNFLYADVELWAKEKGFCDLLIPQIYYGFENSSKPFEDCCKSWQALKSEKSVRLIIGLALYKSGKEDEYAGRGKNEWKNHNDVIARQVRFIRQNNLDGFCLFSAGVVNFNENSAAKQTQNLFNMLS